MIQEMNCYPATDWATVTVTGTWVANATYSAKARRVGSVAEFSVKVKTTGAPTAVQLFIDLPTGYVIDTNKMVTGSSPDNLDDSTTMTNQLSVGGIQYFGVVGYSTTTRVIPTIYLTGATFATRGAITNSSPWLFANNDEVILKFKVPIVGWSEFF